MLACLLVVMALWLGPVTKGEDSEDCIVDDTIVLTGNEETLIHTKETNLREGSVADMYMKPNNTFEGVRLDVIGKDRTKYSVWFPVKDECLHDNKWLKVEITVKIKENGSLNLNSRIGKCEEKCERDRGPKKLEVLLLYARGASMWLVENTMNDECTPKIEGSGEKKHTIKTCEEPPPLLMCQTNPQKDETNNKTSSQITAPIITFLVGAVVGLLVVMGYRKLKNSQTPNDSPSTTGPTQQDEQPTTTVNDMYEPFNHFSPSASTDHGQHSQTPVDIEDDLYATCK